MVISWDLLLLKIMLLSLALVWGLNSSAFAQADKSALPVDRDMRSTQFDKSAHDQDQHLELKLPKQRRRYLVHLPPSYDGTKPMPLVVCLHGGGGDVGFALRMFRLNDKADQENTIVVYPNGSGRVGRHVLTWNAGVCCGYAKAHKIDDIAFIRALLSTVEANFNIDQHRVYLIGFSNGAMMAYELAVAMPEKFAAFAAISGSMSGSEPTPSVPISALIVHGTKDKHIPVGGGPGKLAKWGFNVHAEPLSQAVSFWAKADGCSREPQIERRKGVTCSRYEAGKGGTEVVLYLIDGAGHSWPGGNKAWLLADPPSKALSATDECFEFFSRHERSDLDGLAQSN